MSDSATEDVSPATAFAVLADSTRIDILRALAENSQESVSFSDLRERVGTADSGQFNYHLGKLVGKFVQKDDDGYRLTTAGFQVYGAILAGTYTDTVEFDPVTLDEQCLHCGHSLTVSYVEEHLRVSCDDCERIQVEFAFPPGAFEGRDPEALLETLRQRLRAVVPLAQRGTCPTCWGRTETRLTTDTLTRSNEEILLVSTVCSRCGDEIRASPGALLLDEPAVVAAYYDHGIDLRERPVWTLSWLSQKAVETISTDPLRAQVTVPIADETLLATIEADGTVSAIEREA